MTRLPVDVGAAGDVPEVVEGRGATLDLGTGAKLEITCGTTLDTIGGATLDTTGRGKLDTVGVYEDQLEESRADMGGTPAVALATFAG